MPKRKVKTDEMRAAAARVVSGSTSYGDEGKRLGVSRQAVFAAAKKIRPDTDAPPVDAKPSDSPLDAARRAAGTAPPDSKTPLTPEELKRAGPDAVRMDADYCVTTLNEVKTVAAMGGALLCKVPVTDERVWKLGQLTPNAENAVRTAAPELAPLLRKYLPDGTALIGLVVVLAMDAAGTYNALRELGIEYKKKREAEAEASKKKAEAAAA
jgi:hypothetical protein